jgi:hypothetical protein
MPYAYLLVACLSILTQVSWARKYFPQSHPYQSSNESNDGEICTVFDDIGMEKDGITMHLDTDISSPGTEDPLLDHDEPYTTCRYYLAPSSLPHAGLGIFAGANLTAGSFTPPDIAIHSLTSSELISYRCGFVASLQRCRFGYPQWLLNNYRWQTEGITYQHEQLDVIIPGMGALPNAHLSPALIAAEIYPPSVETLGLHRSIDPGAGASSQYGRSRFFIENEVEQGREILISYGEEYFESPFHKHMKVPFSGDYEVMDEIVEMFVDLFPDRTDSNITSVRGNMNTNVAKHTWNLAQDLISRNGYLNTLAPSNMDQLQFTREIGSARASIPNLVRSPLWLQENGRCLDEIRMKQSTIPQAGRGTFARRSLSKGEVVAPAPLIHIDKRLLEPLNETDPTVGQEIWEALARPLLFNYCWGHAQSNILLFPYSSLVNSINHGQEEVANVELRWSQMKGHHVEWLELPASTVLEKSQSGLVMEFIAKKDIQEGEEILVNYGSRWQESWDQHVTSWKAPDESEQYIAASTMNSLDHHGRLRTIKEIQTDPYPQNIYLECIFPHEFILYAKKHTWPSGEEYVWWYPDNLDQQFFTSTNDDRRECEIIERIKSKSGNDHGPDRFMYNVTMKSKSSLDNMPDNISLVVSELPRTAIQFADKSYTLDEFMAGTFRHHMHLPDEMFPESWIG